MDITPLVPSGKQSIESYGSNGFRISGVHYALPVLVLPNACLPMSISSLQECSKTNLIESLLLSHIELLLVGGGAQITKLPDATRASLKEKHIKLELMDTGAACRTYNVLLAEGRHVAALLMPLVQP